MEGNLGRLNLFRKILFSNKYNNDGDLKINE